MTNFALTRENLVGPAVEILAPLGWASYGLWHRGGTEKIVELAHRGADNAKIDALVTEQWNNESKIFLRNVAIPLRRYGKGIDYNFQRLQFQRGNLVDQAVKCHEGGNYAASFVLTVAQIDGLTRDITGASFFSTSSNDRYLDDRTLSGIASNLPIVREIFNESISSTEFHGKPSRHGAAHGRDLSFGTKTNSTKALVLLGALVEYLEERASKVAAQHRRDRELQSSKLSGIDKEGRLRDDRHLDQLYFLAADLDSFIHSQLILPWVESSTWSQKAYELIKQRGLSRRNFTWGEADSTSYWWSYRTPSGHYLGAGSRRFAAGLDWQRWRWDGSEPPATAPWNDERWIPYDGDSSTPNWTIKPFPLG